MQEIPLFYARWRMDEARPRALQRDSYDVRTLQQQQQFARLNAEDKVIIRALSRRERHTPRQPDLPSNHAGDLHRALWEAAVGLRIEDHLVLSEDRRKPPRNIGDYAISPLLQEDSTFLTDSLSAIPSYSGILRHPPDVRFEYRRPGEAPYIDSAIALGLVYQGGLVAVCSGGLDTAGPLITQIQDVSNKQRPEPVAPVPPDDPAYPKYCAYLEEMRKLPFRSGLRGGIQWRPTLVTAWSSLVAQALPRALPDVQQSAVRVQSARNNKWADADIYNRYAQPTGETDLDLELMLRFTNHYDRVALRLGGALDPSDGNYNLPFTVPAGK